jgi:hypothetical protein
LPGGGLPVLKIDIFNIINGLCFGMVIANMAVAGDG